MFKEEKGAIIIHNYQTGNKNPQVIVHIPRGITSELRRKEPTKPRKLQKVYYTQIHKKSQDILTKGGEKSNLPANKRDPNFESLCT